MASEGMYSGQVRSDGLGQLQSRPVRWVGSSAMAAHSHEPLCTVLQGVCRG